MKSDRFLLALELLATVVMLVVWGAVAIEIEGDSRAGAPAPLAAGDAGLPSTHKRDLPGMPGRGFEGLGRPRLTPSCPGHDGCDGLGQTGTGPITRDARRASAAHVAFKSAPSVARVRGYAQAA